MSVKVLPVAFSVPTLVSCTWNRMADPRMSSNAVPVTFSVTFAVCEAMIEMPCCPVVAELALNVLFVTVRFIVPLLFRMRT
jgi:hypothetical protein